KKGCENLMLPPAFWKSHEPRVIFPVFGDLENVFDFAIQDTLNIKSWRDFARPGYYFLKKQRSFLQTLIAYKWLLLRSKIRFRAAFLDRNGGLIHSWAIPGHYGQGDVLS